MINKVPQTTLNKILEDIKNDEIQKIVVGAVILIEKDSPLLLKRKSDDFMGGLIELPSGTLEPNEDIISGLIREIKEETNLNTNSVDSFIDTFDYISSSGKKTRQINFKVTPLNKNIKLSPEHDSFFVVSINNEEYLNLNISQNTRKSIEKAIL